LQALEEKSRKLLVIANAKQIAQENGRREKEEIVR
jgi:hypothetical protein